jgi:very-short-patch-repair endonuclease
MPRGLRLTEAEYAALLKRKPMHPEGARLLAARARGKEHENELAAMFDALVMPYQREYHFLPPRRFRFDFAMLPLCLRLAVEIDGGVHRIDSRWRSDREKFNLALAAGWRVLHVGLDQIRTGEAVELVLGALQAPAIRTLQSSA